MLIFILLVYCCLLFQSFQDGDHETCEQSLLISLRFVVMLFLIEPENDVSATLICGGVYLFLTSVAALRRGGQSLRHCATPLGAKSHLQTDLERKRPIGVFWLGIAHGRRAGISSPSFLIGPPWTPTVLFSSGEEQHCLG